MVKSFVHIRVSWAYSDNHHVENDIDRSLGNTGMERNGQYTHGHRENLYPTNWMFRFEQFFGLQHFIRLKFFIYPNKITCETSVQVSGKFFQNFFLSYSLYDIALILNLRDLEIGLYFWSL